MAMTEAFAHLSNVDPRMGQLIEQFGELTLPSETVDFHSLATCILGQQLSGTAARSIYRKLAIGLDVDPETGRLTASHFEPHQIESLRPYGLSRQKATYILDLAERTRNDQIHFAKFQSMPDQAIIDELVQVKGIGEWTVQMLLMFSLQRPDVLPVADLGIQNGFRLLFNLDAKPKPKQMIELAELWRPFRSYACLYLWKLKDES